MSQPPRQARFDRWYSRLTLARAVGTILTVATVLVLSGGLLARIVEPETFTSIGLSYWWAITTVTTVGYGDIVPHDTAGRLVGAVLMLTGLSLIPTLSSVVVSLLIAKRSRATQEQQLELYAEHAAQLERIERTLERFAGDQSG